jgi:hypothetical protein
MRINEADIESIASQLDPSDQAEFLRTTNHMPGQPHLGGIRYTRQHLEETFGQNPDTMRVIENYLSSKPYSYPTE